MRISDWSSDVCSADLAAIERGGADLRRAAGGGLDQDVTALGGEAGGVDEAGELDLAQFCRLGLAGELGGDGAVGANGDRLGAFRHLDRGLQRSAVRGPELDPGRPVEPGESRTCAVRERECTAG